MARMARALVAVLLTWPSTQPAEGAAASPTEQAVSPRSRSKDVIAKLESQVLRVLDPDRIHSRISNDAVRMYFVWPAIDGLVSLYEATGKTTYVEHAVSWSKRYRDMGRDEDGDGCLDWDSSWIEGRNHGHVEWRAADGVARTVALILTDPRLEVHRADGEALLDFLETHVWGKWTGGFSDSGSRTTVTHFIGRMGNIALGLYQATGKDTYQEFLAHRGKELKGGLHLNEKDAYIWYTYTGEQRGRRKVVDTSHAGDTVNFIVEAHRAGIVFDQTDIRRLVNTVKRNLWNSSLPTPQFQDYIHGGPETSKWSTGGYGRTGRNQGGWTKLAQFDDELREIYTNWVESEDTPSSPETTIHILGNLARAYRLAEDEGTSP